MNNEKRPDGEPTALKPLIANLNADDPVFDELRADVRRLLDPSPIPTKARSNASPREFWLWVIGKKIEAMKIHQGRRTVIPLGDRPYRLQPYRLRLGNEVFIYADSPRQTGNRRERKRKIVYWLLDQTLVSGEFSEVRVCRQCSKFFTSYRRDAQACGPDCNSKYHNAKYQREGKFMDAYFKRKKERLNEIKKHRDESRPAIIKRGKRAGLTELALVRAKVLPR